MPIILLHGMPGSRTGPHPLVRSLYRRRVRLIAYDRPGYGASSACPGRSVVDAASDVEAIADALGIDRFAVLGRSAGGPYALAAAAKLADRVTAAAVLVGFAPASAPGLGWFEGMHPHNTEIFRMVERPEELRRRLAEATDQIRRDPQEFLQSLRVRLCRRDLRVIEDVPVREQLTTMYEGAFPAYGNSQGWVDDVVALRADWGFDPAEVHVPTYLWHGTEDAFAPIDHTRWLASRIPSSTLCTAVGVGHFGALEALPGSLSWLAEHHLRTTG